MATRSLESELLIAVLRECYEEGKTATYKILEAAVAECSTRRRSLLSGAIKAVAIEYGYLFKCVTLVGYKPMKREGENIEIIEKTRINKIKSQVNKFDIELQTIDYAALKPKEKEKYFSAQARLSVHQMVLDERLNDTYLNAGKRCANSGKIEFNLKDINNAFKALNMS